MQQFSSFVMIFSLVYINLFGTDVLGWCIDELFRCLRDILTGCEINEGNLCDRLLKLDWSFTTCVAVKFEDTRYGMFEDTGGVVLVGQSMKAMCWIVWYA